MDPEEIGWEEVDWVCLLRVGASDGAFVNTVMNFSFPQNVLVGSRLTMAYRGGSPRPIRMVFLVAKVTLGQVLLRLPRFLLSSFH
jgi:hypothetical protein